MTEPVPDDSRVIPLADLPGHLQVPLTPEQVEILSTPIDVPRRLMIRRIPDPTDPAQIQGTVDREAFRRERQGHFVVPDPTEDYGRFTAGPTYDEQERQERLAHARRQDEHARNMLYAEMRERQALGQPAITRAELERQGLLPPSPAVANARIPEEVRQALLQGNTPEEVNARLRELGFEYAGQLPVAQGIVQRHPNPSVDLNDVYTAIRSAARTPTDDQVMSSTYVPEHPLGSEVSGPNRTARRRGCQCGNPNRAYTVHSEGARCRPMTAQERRRQQVEDVSARSMTPNDAVVIPDSPTYRFDSQIVNWGQEQANDNDPLTAIRTRRPLPPRNADGTVRGFGMGIRDRDQLACWCGDPSIPGAHTLNHCEHDSPPSRIGTGDTLRERLLRHRVDEVVEEPPPPTEPSYVDPGMVTRARKHMDEVFGDLEQKSKGELLDLIATMRKDWETLNDIHNRRANRSGWCSEYEERQERHNASFRALKLISRIQGGPSDEYQGSGL